MMKKVILGLIMVALLAMAAGCSNETKMSKDYNQSKIQVAQKAVSAHIAQNDKSFTFDADMNDAAANAAFQLATKNGYELKTVTHNNIGNAKNMYFVKLN
ncbi:MAG: hypothetical protein ACM3UU_04015 [Ignavibacteriales bacterium]